MENTFTPQHAVIATAIMIRRLHDLETEAYRWSDGTNGHAKMLLHTSSGDVASGELYNDNGTVKVKA